VQDIAMRFNVSMTTAALILAQQMGIPAMAEGGHAKRREPVIVGEHGPEVFTPDVPGSIAPPMKVLPSWHANARRRASDPIVLR
jgi:hypothetical protein